MQCGMHPFLLMNVPLLWCRVLVSENQGRTFRVVNTVTRRKLMLTGLKLNHTYHVTVITKLELRVCEGDG